MTTVDRLNTLVRQQTETAFETAAFVQRQNAELFQNWLTIVEANQKAARDFALQTVQRAQEAQSLWVEIVQESFDTGIDNVTTFAQNGMKETSEQVEKVTRQAKADKAEATK
jgi:polyhydroxyalkanoate synthesis regulator phasin